MCSPPTPGPGDEGSERERLCQGQVGHGTQGHVGHGGHRDRLCQGQGGPGRHRDQLNCSPFRTALARACLVIT